MGGISRRMGGGSNLVLATSIGSGAEVEVRDEGAE